MINSKALSMAISFIRGGGRPLFVSGITAVLFMLACCLPSSFSQGITTSAINGRVVDYRGDSLPGAMVRAVHTPSGSIYETAVRIDGRYNLPLLQPGGPYTISVSFPLHRTEELSGIYAGLGTDKYISIILFEEPAILGEVLVHEFADSLFDSARSGSATSIDSALMLSVPAVFRNVNDFTRFVPQSHGTSFAGRDNRFNSYTLNGIIYNNNFGPGNSGLAGANPLSNEAIDAILVNLAGYDVRQGGYSGAGVNMITKRGGNRFSGSAYAWHRDNALRRTAEGQPETATAGIFSRILGVTGGGPVLRDRLFFFAGLEYESSVWPGLPKESARPGLAPDGESVSRVPAAELEFVREMMMQIYGYETGPFEGYEFGGEGLRINARIDYNAGMYNKLNVIFNHYTGFQGYPVNRNSLSYHPAGLRYLNTTRQGTEAMNFRNSHYIAEQNVTSVSSELNSFILPGLANNLRAGFVRIGGPERRIPGDQPFPFIEVLESEGNAPLYYMTLGNELFSAGNAISNNVFQITNDLSWFTGRHSFTFGVQLEYMTFENAFNPAYHGVYRFNSYDDFVAAVIERDPAVMPGLFLQGYSLAGENPPADEMAFGQFSIYAQDRFEFNPQLNFTYGLRVDFPFYPIDLPGNPGLQEMDPVFINPRTGERVLADVASLPPFRPQFSPRLGIVYDVLGDLSLQVWGGTGIFTGRIPFVWISNQANSNGIARGGFGLMPGDWGEEGNPVWQGFSPDPGFYRPDFAGPVAEVPDNLALTDREFRLPQVWRSTAAIEYNLPFDVTVALEGVYSLDLNSPIAVNMNASPESIRLDEPYDFPYWFSPAGYYSDRRFRDVILLTNINEGFYASATARISALIGRNFDAMAAWTRSVATDYGLTGGFQASSLWPNTVVYDRNHPEIGYSRFDRPNRIIARATVNTRASGNRFNTGFTIIYEGGERGRYDYTYSGRFNDGAARLMYVPESFDDSGLVDKAENGAVVMTAARQWEILDEFISRNEYLNENRGRVTERNGAILPWLHRFDIRIVQDFAVRSGTAGFRLQAFADILNFGNMVNSGWGVYETRVRNNLLNFEGVDGAQNGMFTLNTIPGTDDFPATVFTPLTGLTRTWSVQFGLRLLFE